MSKDINKIEILDSNGELVTFEELVNKNKNVRDAIERAQECGLSDEELISIVETIAQKSLG